MAHSVMMKKFRSLTRSREALTQDHALRARTLRTGMIVIMLLLFSLFQAEASDLLKAGDTIHDYQYTSSDRRDPFHVVTHSNLATDKTSSIVEDSTAKLSEAGWTLLGIMAGSKGFHAMIQSAEGRRYIVSTGDELFSKNMRVARITSSRVKLAPLATHHRVDGGLNSPSLELTFTPSVQR